jgi:hypothetical protein
MKKCTKDWRNPEKIPEEEELRCTVTRIDGLAVFRFDLGEGF